MSKLEYLVFVASALLTQSKLNVSCFSAVIAELNVLTSEFCPPVFVPELLNRYNVPSVTLTLPSLPSTKPQSSVINEKSS